MRPNIQPSLPERYAIEQGLYVLYVGAARVIATRAVAVLIDTRLDMLITHGDPASVRREVDEMRQILRSASAADFDEDWLLLEGRPRLELLNSALSNAGCVAELKDAFSGVPERSAREETSALMARLSRRRR